MKEYMDYPTITKLSIKEKNDYKFSHINILDLLRRMDILEQQREEYKNSRSIITQKISNHENEINKLKTTCNALEMCIQKRDVKIGEIIKFGRYEGKDIEWRILDINQKDNSVLLISKYLLFEKKFNEAKGDCTWETSTIRRYLNNEFYRNSFNEEEKRKIKEEVIKNPDNKRYGTKGGNDTIDKVFLLSIDEAKKYFRTEEERKTTLTGINLAYWLRSPGNGTLTVAFVGYGGGVFEEGEFVGRVYIGARPALWINL